MGESTWVLGLALAGALCLVARGEDCGAVLAGDGGDEEKVLACQLFETALLVSEMSDSVVEGLASNLVAKGITVEDGAAEGDGVSVDKRKHEYLRFGKRKHEYLRFGKRSFGKRKHEYLRFGKRKHEYLRFGKRKHEYLRFGRK